MSLWQRRQRVRLLAAFTAVLMMIQLVAGVFAGSASAASDNVTYEEQPGGTSQWVVVGSFQGWNNASEKTQMKHIVGGFYTYTSEILPAGTHEFKLVKSGTWTGYDNNGENFSLQLAEPASVKFYVNEELGQARISVPGVAGLQQYIPQLDAAQHPRLVGDVQRVFGEAEWSPDQAQQFFVDYNFNNTVYKLQRTLPAGTYQAKVLFGSSWSGANYGTADGKNLELAVLDAGAVTFTIDLKADVKALSHNYVAQDGAFDGKIKKEAIAFDSRSVTFKKPFGAIPAAGQDLKLRIAAAAGDVQTAKAELTSPDGMSAAYLMTKATTVDGKDYFEVTVPASAFGGRIGVWGYKFILVDGMSKVEFGDDSARGGSGAVADEGALPYDLTVYAPQFKTPDWMKNAVVYQIFPDRFFDGSKDNNRAKLLDGARGALDPQHATPKNGQKLQYFDGGVPNDPAADQVWGAWNDAPENPDRLKPENQPYYPESESDGAWTNEFYGGDIQGIEQKLSYLKNLGITAVYLNPVAWAASNHKYDATDYKHLDPMFGQPVYNTPGDPASGLDYVKTREASDLVFSNFAKAAKAAGIRIINDGVFNHVGDDSIYFDRYSKYPEIGAYEYWAAVYGKVNGEGLSKEAAEAAVRAEFTSQINPLTGVNYKFPEDFMYVTWFTVENAMVKNRDDDGLHYKYDAWWGYDSLPVMDAKEPQLAPTEYLPADGMSLPGQHEWNSIHYRDNVIGSSLAGLGEAEAQKHLQTTGSQRWLWMGTSGWRLDVAPDVSAGTWSKFREAVKSTAGRTDANGSTIDEPVLIGEEWGVATKFLLGDQFDSVMNYRFRAALQSFLGGGSAESMNEALESIREDYPKEAWQALMNLVDSHDTIRSITKYDHPEWEEEHLVIAEEASDKAVKLQELTAIFQMGYPGAPSTYYGSEVGLSGTKDPDSRKAFPWERVSANGDGTFTGTGKYAGLFSTYQKAAGLRNTYPVFRTGDLKAAYAQGEVIAYARKDDAKGALVVINRSSEAKTIEADVAGFLPEGLQLKDLLQGGLTAAVSGGKVTLTVPATTGLMMVSEGELHAAPAVTGVSASGGNGEVSLSWNAAEGADGYRIYRAAMEGGAVTLIGTAEVPAYKDTTVANGTKYYYAVTALAGGGEGFLSDMASATPAYLVNEVGAPSTITESVYAGVGKATQPITVTVTVYGLTDNPAYTGKEAPGLITRLAYYKDGTDPEAAQDTKLRYQSDTDLGSKVYQAAFEPTDTGLYRYLAKVSADNGETYTVSPSVTVAVYGDPADTTPPAAPLLEEIATESNRATLKWTADAEGVSGYEVLRKEAGEAGFRKIAVMPASAREYTDYAVSNDTAYTYAVAAYDAFYNRSRSAEQSVTPKLVMVDVKMRLHLPDYTPTTDDITIAGSFNGWNVSSTKLQVPSGATDRRVVEYTFKMMAGKSIDYKYARGKWETEAFTSHKRMNPDTEDYGNWAYGSTNTNMQLTIKNQGGNQMVVDDYILRWKDMPMILTLPRTTYGEDVTYSTAESSFHLKGVVPYGVAFTINGQPLPEGAMSRFGEVNLEQIPLNPGENRFELHIEPTAETLNQPWYEDKGRKDNATKTLTLNITRTTGGEEPSAELTGISVNTEAVNLTVGGTHSVVTTAVYADAALNKIVTAQAAYASSSEAVASVDAAGRITAKSAGTAKITVTYEGKTAEVTVTVTAPAPAAERITVNAETVNLTVGGTHSVVTTAVYADAALNKIVTAQAAYTSSSEAVASVDAAGLITAKSAGTAKITVTYEGKTAEVTVTVTAPAPAAERITVNTETVNLTVGGTHSVVTTAVYADAALNKIVTAQAAYASSSEAVASVDAAGRITAKSAGTAKITVTYEGKTAVVDVTVTEAASGGDNGNDNDNDNSSDNSSGGGTSGNSAGTPAQQDGTKEQPKKVTPGDLAKRQDGQVTVELGAAESELQLPANAATLLEGGSLRVKKNGVSVQLTAALLGELAKLLPAGSDGGSLTLHISALPKAEAESLAAQASKANEAAVKALSEVYDFQLGVLDKDGKRQSLQTFREPVTLTFSVEASADRSSTGVYYLADNGELEYAEGTWNGGELSAKVSHFSKYAVLEFQAEFTDLPAGHWASPAVQALAAKGIVNGTGSKRFAPEQSVTRAEFAAMVVRALRLEVRPNQAHPFADVASGSWYAGAVATAYNSGIVGGRDAQTFAPDELITREEMAMLIMRAYSVKAGGKAPSGSTLSSIFSDAGDVSAWAVDSVQSAVKLKLLQGRDAGIFAPGGTTTRAESAQVIYNLLASK
ncbi:MULTISPECIES: S-layer homology domain-containing protein [Paenibacillus]|uniref:S-layer homology domain-containing protein n=1 Tax=Paenibacillus TaxID=44249 RepID=UPI0022B8F8DC|nr:S-layer homology domain-containing protein [Paenibacillus caseinilyticus]MCZ8521145.1 alpha-amylase family glycosyl hydrolase [Paenibacillus caseinilyticus]